MTLRSLEICAGAGGQALGLERAGFTPVMLVDDDSDCCATLRTNRPHWNVCQIDLRELVAAENPEILDVDLMAGGVPCTPYTVAGEQRGARDERDLLAALVWLAYEVRPKAIMVENVPALLKDERFRGNREFVQSELGHLGYRVAWRILQSEDYGIAQRRPHSILIALMEKHIQRFRWPQPTPTALTIGDVLGASMSSNGWEGAAAWAAAANSVAPTIVGGSKKHGGADLGPTGAKRAWAHLQINGGSLADEPPGPDFELVEDSGPNGRDGLPKLTIPQVALLQGFPDTWSFAGRKTSRYRQVAQAFPPPVAEAIGRSLAEALHGRLQSALIWTPHRPPHLEPMCVVRHG